MTVDCDWRKRGWAGLDLIPLPYESRWGVLLRFAWRNALRESTLAGTHLLQSFLRPHEELDDEGRRIAPFVFPEAISVPDTTGVYCLDECWLTRRFRYCPLCLEAGYHTALFQIRAIGACPFHRAQLSDRCHCCGTEIPILLLSRPLLAPYFCERCEEAISGVPPSLEAHLDFRENSADLEKAMAPYVTWWKTVIRHQRGLYGEPGMSSTSYAKWCTSPQFVWALACKDVPGPEFVMPSRHTDGAIVTLRWHCRIATDLPRYWECDFRGEYGQAVYLSTLKILRRWIMREEGGTVDEFDRRVTAHSFKPKSDASIRFQAFVALRSQNEHGFAYSGENNLCAQSRAELQALFTLRSRYGRRATRLEWRAIFLALYVSWYTSLSRNGSDASTEVWSDYESHAQKIFLNSRLVGEEGLNRIPICGPRPLGNTDKFFRYQNDPEPIEAWFEGSASFLRVAGMPLPPWDRASRNKILSWKAAHEGGGEA